MIYAFLRLFLFLLIMQPQYTLFHENYRPPMPCQCLDMPWTPWIHQAASLTPSTYVHMYHDDPIGSHLIPYSDCNDKKNRFRVAWSAVLFSCPMQYLAPFFLGPSYVSPYYLCILFLGMYVYAAWQHTYWPCLGFGWSCRRCISTVHIK